MLRGQRLAAIFPKEGDEDQPEDVEAGHDRRRQAYRVKDVPTRLASRSGALQDRAENRVFAPEAIEWEDRRQRQPSYDEHPKDAAQPLAKTAHLADVLLAAERVNHR